MSSLPKIAMIVGAALVGTASIAQIQPIPEQQLANGFLGDRNAKLTEHDPVPNETFADQAMRAINLKQYKRALDILKPHRLANDPAYFYLAGRAQEGLGDYAAARKNLTVAVKKNKNFIGAHLALGLLGAEHGDKAAAIKVLDGLKVRQAQCAGLCKDAAGLSSSIAMIEAALKLRKD
jgi:tetratricopeptide (TPR) repeat protein